MPVRETIYKEVVHGPGHTSYTPIGFIDIPDEQVLTAPPTPVIHEPDYSTEHGVDNGWLVTFDWSSVVPDLDRPDTGGIYTGPGTRGKRLAERLAAATRAGLTHKDAYVRKDIYGKSYVAATCKVSGKYLNADLSKLGY